MNIFCVERFCLAVRARLGLAVSRALAFRKGFEMKIQVSQIREDEGLRVRHLYPKGEPGLVGDDAHISGLTSLELVATRDGDQVKLVGQVKADVQIECDRCLAPVAVTVDQSFDLLYIPASASRAPEEGELADDDLSAAPYEGDLIDLDDVVREQVELAIPMARLCSEECKGLCPECGVNLNEGDCGCSIEQIDPRWAALKLLKSDN